MKIKDIQPTTLIDYPGLIATNIFCQGCNFNCKYCYNQTLIPLNNEPYLEIKDIFDFLEQRKNILEGIVITGGEPTIQPELPVFIKELTKFNLKIKLDTNGYNPKIIEKLIEDKSIDYFAMDIKAPLNKYANITQKTIDQEKIKTSINLIKSSGIDHEFRTTIWQEDFSIKDLDEILKLIAGAQNFYLQNFSSQNQDIPKLTPFTKEMLRDFFSKRSLSQNENFFQLRGEFVAK